MIQTDARTCETERMLRCRSLRELAVIADVRQTEQRSERREQ